MMGRIEDYLKRQRAEQPPKLLAVQVERDVMNRLPQVHRERRRTRNRAMVLAFSTAVIVIGILVLSRSKPQAQPSVCFVESVIVLDDHVCIWLESLSEAEKGVSIK